MTAGKHLEHCLAQSRSSVNDHTVPFVKLGLLNQLKTVEEAEEGTTSKGSEAR